MHTLHTPTTDIPNSPFVVTISDYDQYFYIGFDTFAAASDYIASTAPHDWYRAMTEDIAPNAQIVAMYIDENKEQTMHKQTLYVCGFWHGKHSSESDQMTTNELQGYANACMLGMIERQELPANLTYKQEIECEDSWVQGYNDARQI